MSFEYEENFAEESKRRFSVLSRRGWMQLMIASVLGGTLCVSVRAEEGKGTVTVQVEKKDEGGKVIEVTEKTFEVEVLKSKIPVLLEFWAEWCPTCLKMKPVLEKLAKEYKGKATIAKVDVDKEENLSRNIEYVPHFFLFVDGKSIEDFTGSATEENLKKKLDKAIKDLEEKRKKEKEKAPEKSS